MLTVISGVPGSGKTLYALTMIEKAVKEGRAVYTDVDQCTLDVDPVPDDWRECPDGSLIVYDEAHQRFPATGRAGVADDPRVKDMDEHRHRGMDLVLITQASTRMHHDVRKMASEHIHLQRIFGLQQASVFRWQRAANETDKGERSEADQQTFRFPKRLYKAYASATVHTHKVKLPRKVVTVVGVALAIVAGALWSISGNEFVEKATGEQAASASGSTAAPPPQSGASQSAGTAGPQVGQEQGDQATDRQVIEGMGRGNGMRRWDQAYAAQVPEVKGCITSNSRCQCYGADGRVLDLRPDACRRLADKPLPMKLQDTRREPEREWEKS